jgi:hypothetical protein
LARRRSRADASQVSQHDFGAILDSDQLAARVRIFLDHGILETIVAVVDRPAGREMPLCLFAVVAGESMGESRHEPALLRLRQAVHL